VQVTAGIADKEEAQRVLAEAAHKQVAAYYAELDKAIKDTAFRAANKQFAQPWKA
jgi:hypothetical protein